MTALRPGRFRLPRWFFHLERLKRCYLSFVFFWRSTAFVRIDQLSGRPTNNSAVAMLDLSELISSAPFSADSSPPLTETLVVSAPAATPPSFVLSAQDLTQAFSRALGESLPHILATMQSHSKNTCSSVSRFTSAGNMLSNSNFSGLSAINSPPPSAGLSSGNFDVPSFISTYYTLGNSPSSSPSLFGPRDVANVAFPAIGHSSAPAFSIGSVHASTILPGILSSLNRPFVVGVGYSPFPEKLVTKIR